MLPYETAAQPLSSSSVTKFVQTFNDTSNVALENAKAAKLQFSIHDDVVKSTSLLPAVNADPLDESRTVLYGIEVGNNPKTHRIYVTIKNNNLIYDMHSSINMIVILLAYRSLCSS